MQCEECKEQLLEMVYEEGVRPHRRLELLGHIDVCPLCHEEYTGLLESRSLLQQWPDAEPTWSLRVAPAYQARSARRAFALPVWAGRSWPVLKTALAMLLLAVALLAATRSQLTWNNGGLTIHARLWKGGDAAAAPASPQELLATVDRMLAESEQRQNKLFGTALIKMWEDMEIRNQYEYGEIQTAFEGLQRQNSIRIERPVRSGQ